ncbi:MAG: S8 family serine peptidase, partial [Bacteroidota bacterium]
MKVRLFYTLLLLLCSASWIFSSGTYKVTRGERPTLDYQKLQEKDYKKGVIVIKFRMDYENHLETHPMAIEKDGLVRFHMEDVDRLTALYGVRGATQHFSSAAFRDGFTPRHKAWGFHLWYRLELDEKAHIPSVVEEFARLREIEIAEPVLRKEIIGTHDEKDFIFVTQEELQQKDTWTPNDPQFNNQWHYQNTGQQNGTPGSDISLPQAWSLEKGDTAVIVAIVDGGIDHTHDDLEGNMWYQIGFNFVNNTPNIEPHNHGTHVAGTIAAVSNNNLGVAGVAGGSGSNDGVRLMSCQVFAASDNGGFHLAPIYAADNGAAISQNSWGYTSPGFFEQSVLDAIDYFNINGGGDAMDGGITIFAAGNSDSSGDYYPGFYTGTFSVAATSNTDQKSWYSNYGSWVDISAPGGETNTVTERGVLSTLNGNQYGYYQGTSMACPHVSGVVALMLSSVYGEFSPQDVADILVNTTDNHYGVNPGFIGQLGAGRLNAHHAVALSQLYLSLPSNPTDFEAVGTSDSQIDLSWLKNETADNVLLAWSPTGDFGIPEEGVIYQPGEEIDGGGQVLFAGDAEAFIHDELSAATLYYYKLWSVDADTLYSLGRSAHTYTQCGVTTLPVSQDFSSGEVPYCWAFPNGQGNWNMVSNRGNPAPAIEFNWSPAVTNYEYTLESPPLDGNIPGNAIALEFDIMLSDYDNATVEELWVQVYDGENWITVSSFDNTQGDIAWETHFVDITPHALNTIFMVRFTAKGENSYNINYWVIDNFNVYSFSCPQPTELTAAEITTNSALISWIPVGEETTWDLVWGTPGFDPNTGGTLVSGLPTAVYSLEGLETFTNYQVYVRA